VVVSSSGNDGNPLLDDAGNRLIAPAATADALWATGWDTTFRAIKGTKTALVQIRDTPWPGHDAPECLAENSRRISECAAPAAESIALPDRQVLVDRTAKAHGARVVDPIPWFCTADSCPAVVGNVLVWRDDDHITTKYASMLVPLLSARLPR
jgi:hypothetical protein